MDMDLEECFTDSPHIRLQISRAEEYIGEVEAKCKALAKASRASVEATHGIQKLMGILIDQCVELIAKNMAFVEALTEYGQLEERMSPAYPEAEKEDDELRPASIIRKRSKANLHLLTKDM